MTQSVRRAQSVLALLAVIAAAVATALAGTTGTLKGKVTDLKTGEPLPLVNVLVVGSGRGGVTNKDGEFTIQGVTAGVYSIRVSLLGYQTIEAKKVTIDADKTTVYSYKLASEDIELEGVTVEGKPPIVDVSKTAGDQTFSRDKIESLPAVKDVGDVLRLQAGVVQFGGQMFLRGGRANETQILVDGVVVSDASGAAAANQELQQIYAGNASGGSGLSVSAAAIQSVSVSSGGLDGEYGNAQSGVVNITTRSGGENYSVSAEYRTDGITDASAGERYYNLNFGGPEPITMSLLPELGLSIPGRMGFFVNTTFNQRDGAYPWNTGQFYTPLERSIKPFGITYTDKQSNNFDFFAKLTYVPDESNIFFYSYKAAGGSYHPLSGGFSYIDRSDSSVARTTELQQHVVQWTHLFSQATQLRGYVSYTTNDGTSGVGNLPPWAYAPVASDPNGDGFTDLGNSQRWSNYDNSTWNMKVNLESKVHELHRLRTGFEFYSDRILSTEIYRPTAPEREINPNAQGEYPGYGFTRWAADNSPNRGAFWVQDDIEFGRLNIKVILRYDFVDLGPEIYTDEWVARWEDVTGQKADVGELTGGPWLDNGGFWNGLTSGHFSPRFAIGYPISTETVFYFNYGTFLQFPEWTYYFRDPVPATEPGGNYTGNPALKPQKTISYEAGFDQAIFTDFSLGLRGFYKDIFDYTTFRAMPISPAVDVPVNLDYASSRGFEVIISKSLSDHYFGSFNYSYSISKGRSEDPRAVQGNPGLAGLPRETRMPWDQQHTLNFFVGYSVGPNEEYDVFGLNINDWNVSFSWQFGSGFPYTPYTAGQTLSDLYLRNSETGPAVSQFDFSLSKGFRLVGGLRLALRMDVKNLFNRLNVDMNAGGFNNQFGRVIEYGDYNPRDLYVYPWYGGGTSFDARVPPYAFLPPRQILFGVKLTWD